MPYMVSRGRRRGKFGLRPSADEAGSLRRKLSAQMGLAVRREAKRKHGLFLFPSALVLFGRKGCFMVQFLISHHLRASSRSPSSLCGGGFRQHPAAEGLGEGRAPQRQGTEPPSSYLLSQSTDPHPQSWIRSHGVSPPVSTCLAPQPSTCPSHPLFTSGSTMLRVLLSWASP